MHNRFKTLIISVIFVCATQFVSAYDFDVIITTEREQIQCYIKDVNEDEITYYLFDDSGILYHIPRSQVQKMYPRTQDSKHKYEKNTVYGVQIEYFS